MILLSFAALNVGGDDAEITIADVENESGGSIGRPRRGDSAPSIKGLNPVVTRTRFSSHREQFPVGQAKDAIESPRGAAFHHRCHRLSHGPSHLRSEHLLS